MNILKNFLGKILLLFLVSTCASLSATKIMTQPSNDTFIKDFVRTQTSDRVIYKNETLTLLVPSPASDIVLSKGVGTLMLGAAGVGFIYLGTSKEGIKGNDAEFNRMLSVLTGIFMIGCGGYLGYDLSNQFAKAQSNSIYLEFDNKGLRCKGARVLKWCEVSKIEIYKKSLSVGANKIKIRCADFKDKYAGSLFSLVEHDESLPISFDSFVAISQHFVNTYGCNNN